MVPRRPVLLLALLVVLLLHICVADDDLASDGPCEALISQHCPGVTSGKGEIAACLRRSVFKRNPAAPLIALPVPSPPSDECRSSFHAFMISISTDLTNSKTIRDACQTELTDPSPCSKNPGPFVLICLRDLPTSAVTASCLQALTDEKIASALDVDLDPAIVEGKWHHRFTHA